MEWHYDVSLRIWHLSVGGWQAFVERWPSGFEYAARIEAQGTTSRTIRAPQVFDTRDASQAWCATSIAEQRLISFPSEPQRGRGDGA